MVRIGTNFTARYECGECELEKRAAVTHRPRRIQKCIALENGGNETEELVFGEDDFHFALLYANETRWIHFLFASAGEFFFNPSQRTEKMLVRCVSSALDKPISGFRTVL